MGQYYKPTSVDKMESLYTHDYGSLSKLMEHSYINNDFVEIVEYMLSPKGKWHKHSFVWAGDYADEEKNSEKNLYMIAKEIQLKDYPEGSSGRYIVNHTKKQYVDKDILPEDEEGWSVHPLPLLTCEGNGRGGGDYRLWNDCVGYWSRDKISVEKKAPKDYEELIPNFEMD
tara:strand:- start:1761 stop:2273 length:513 start_codon:yes stop_codon:yes gene_type:complete